MKKILVASDLHGDEKMTRELVSLFKKHDYTDLYLLGDLESSIDLLNPLKEHIKAVKGNCDTAFDVQNACFELPDVNYDYQFKRLIVLTHGHLYSPYDFSRYDIFLHGHTHRSYIRRENGRIYANPGSLSRPRDGLKSFIEMDETGIKIIEFTSKTVLDKLEFEVKL